MTTQLHLISQYLAAAGISFVAKKKDDSHTNLGFSIDNSCLYTRDLNHQKNKLYFNYNTFALEWKSPNSMDTLKLDGVSHVKVLEWIKQLACTNNLGTYKYDFHYDLPYKIQDNYTFQLKDISKLHQLKSHRILAHRI